MPALFCNSVKTRASCDTELRGRYWIEYCIHMYRKYAMNPRFEWFCCEHTCSISSSITNSSCPLLSGRLLTLWTVVITPNFSSKKYRKYSENPALYVHCSCAYIGRLKTLHCHSIDLPYKMATGSAADRIVMVTPSIRLVHCTPWPQRQNTGSAFRTVSKQVYRPIVGRWPKVCLTEVTSRSLSTL